LYTADIPSLFPIHSATGHLFADDTQAYVHGPPSAQLQLAGCIDALTRDLDLWMSSNRLSLNSSKTQLIWLGTPQQLQKLDYSLLSDKFPSFVFSSSVRDLGVILDSTLSFTEHISKLTRISYFHLRRASGLFANQFLHPPLLQLSMHLSVPELITVIPFLLVYLKPDSLLFSLYLMLLLDL
jgi:hypothetical protein